MLTGQRPGALDAELAQTPAAQPGRATVLAVGDVSDLLRRRPDVRAAERRLAAETARTGVATADLFPRVNVTGFVGLLSGDVGTLFRSSSNAWAVSPSVSWPAFDSGGRASPTSGAEGARHRKPDRLPADRSSRHRGPAGCGDGLPGAPVRTRRPWLEQVAAARRASDFARDRFKEGDIDFLRVLDADRTRLQAEDALTEAQTDANTDVVAVYKALGGSRLNRGAALSV